MISITDLTQRCCRDCRPLQELKLRTGETGELDNLHPYEIAALLNMVNSVSTDIFHLIPQ